MDIQSLFAAQSYTSSKPALQPVPETTQGAKEAFVNVAEDFAQTVQAGEETAKAAMVGQADPHALVQALAQSELAVETAVTVRNKVVEAYQEILRMPV
ncbi:flagellar hook-basal body complex protein FliE [Primorskyibacter flagellatus]|uniref:Flagellar hook-basal body complex protein FliE n=1 Tax=Primorskyibacter flagellatus TaxID=1387277 RepID=A0A1W2A8F3_9RHOB|nr:flagellar hook-basal body complex protein FliE [Primorskyibacter flagellatus]SMC56916.1 flagellar hook-basal body complex protein FliE [Primorskyibacter flagellatus]